MSAETSETSRRSYGAILFDLILIGFSALIVSNALGLRPNVAMVPLLVGIPTLVMAIVLLAVDLLPGLRLGARGGDTGGGVGQLRQSIIRAAAKEEEEVELDTAPESRRQHALFTAWVVAFVALAFFVSFYIAMAVALVAIFAWIRLPWWHTAAIVVGTLGGFYVLFHVVLNVRL